MQVEVYVDRSDWPITVQLGECDRRPLTEHAARLVGQNATAGICAWRCDKCFSQDGVAFWHVGPITYRTVFVMPTLAELAE